MSRIQPGTWFRPDGPGHAHLVVPDERNGARSACGAFASLLPTDRKASDSDARCPGCVATVEGPEGGEEVTHG